MNRTDEGSASMGLTFYPKALACKSYSHLALHTPSGWAAKALGRIASLEIKLTPT